MKKIVLLIIVLVIFTGQLYSQETQTLEKQNFLGINAGLTTGVGFSYKHWHNNIGFQISGIPVKFNSDLDYSIGITGFYSFKQKDNSKIFLYMGHHIMTDGFYFIYDVTQIMSFLNNNSDYNYNIGVGIGAEFGKNPVFSVMGGYAAYDLTGEDYKLLPTVELGLHFKLSYK